MSLVDTHCHIHSADFGVPVDEVVAEAAKAGVKKMICVGTDPKDSELAVEFARKHKNCWASIGLHPHDAKHYVQAAPKPQPAKPIADSALSAHRVVTDSSAPSPYKSYGSVRSSSAPSAASEPEHSASQLEKLKKLATHPKVIAIGECGLDYYYNHSPKEMQKEALHFQLDLAQKHSLPVIFHIREAFDDFWPIFDRYKDLKGVIHSFTASTKVMDEALSRGLYLGLNGIMTFTKDSQQLAMAKAVPLNKLLLETDAPFLTPAPYRGTVCQPKHVEVIARFLSNLRGESFEELANATTQNAEALFNLKYN